MRPISKIACIGVAFFVLASVSLAEENLGARPMGMGGAFTGLADDVNAIFANPAGIGSFKEEAASVSMRVSSDSGYTMLGGVQITPFGNIGIGYVELLETIEGTWEASEWDGSPDKYYTQTLYVSYAQELNHFLRVPKNMGELSFGMNVKFSSYKLNTPDGLSHDGGSVFDMDVASIFKINEALSLGMTVKDLLNGESSGDVLNTSGNKIYSALFGASGKIFGGNLTWTAESGGLGCEWQPVSGFALRAGQGKDNISAGFGVDINGVKLDYAYLNKGSPVSYWTISILPDEWKAQINRASFSQADTI